MTGRTTWSTLISKHGIVCDLIRLDNRTIKFLAAGIEQGPTTNDIILSVKMMRRYAEEDKLEHEISQRDARFVVEYTALQSGGYPLPPKKNDRVKSLGQFYTVTLVEPKMSHGELVGYQLRCTGGT